MSLLLQKEMLLIHGLLQNKKGLIHIKVELPNMIKSNGYQLIISLLAFFICSSSLLAQSVLFNEVVSSNSQTLFDEDGDSPDWIELYNPGEDPIDLCGYGLSDKSIQLFKWTFPSIVLPSNSFLVVFASGKDRDYRHTNFKINSSGESLFLSSPEGLIVDSVEIPNLPVDVSYGRQDDYEGNWFYFMTPTPWEANNSTAYNTPTPGLVDFSPKGGLHDGSVSVTLSTSLPESKIYYTLDGSVPDDGSAIANNSLTIDNTTVVRARIKTSGVFLDLTNTHSYVINKETDLAVMSITAIPDDLWNSTTGIYINYESDEEIPVHIELYDPKGAAGFSQDVGMKMFGGWSRHFPQKSFAFFARKQYGLSNINYKLFPTLHFNEYESFVLRNSGGDFDITHVRDAMMQQLIADIDLETQAYRPVVVYLNGEYWGILNMREKLNEHYIEAHQGIKEEDLDMLQNNQDVIHGDNEHYNAMIDYIDNNDMALAESYSHIKNQIDIDNYLNYMVSELYFGNVDWPGWNIKYWRPRTENGKWRWMVYDLDDGFWQDGPEYYGYDNMYYFALATNGEEWPNPPWSTLLFRRLLENDEFFEDFVNRYADYMNTIWQPAVVNHKIALIQDEIDEEMVHHLARWNLSYNDWQDEMDILHEFANARVEEVYSNTISYFNLLGLVDLDIHIETAGGGVVHLNNTLDIYNPLWHGIYFQDIPVQVEAIAQTGYKFIGWNLGGIAKSSPKLKLPMSDNTIITAYFEPDGAAISPIVINEINYNSSDYFDSGDWIELYNRGNETIDMSGWKFKDEDDSHELIFPEGTSILAHDYLVLVKKPNAFQSFFPEVSFLPQNFDFGLSNGGEHLRLLDSEGKYIDSLTYGDKSPWPAMADGQGATLELKNAFSDNSLAKNWLASVDYGTPGAPNSIIIQLLEQPQYKEHSDISFLFNYPNPFSVETNISFQLPFSGQIRVRIFDIMGVEIASLFDGVLEKGKHQLVWHPSVNLKSGIFFCRLEFNQQSKSVFMIYTQ